MTQKSREELAAEYARKNHVRGTGGFDTESWLDDAFLAGHEAGFLAAKNEVIEHEMKEISELTRLQAENEELRLALEFYANHESVIKEAYHSNDSGQVTCVHTFINHVATEILAKYPRGK